MNKVSASILTCNFAQLGQDVLAAQKGGAHSLHVDIVDGIYADNFSVGPKTVADLKEVVSIPIHVHFELFEPIRYIDMFADAGADSIAIQMDSCACPIRSLNLIRNRGMQTGLGIAPKERVEQAEYLMDYLDYIILMTVEPGFGGQKFGEFIYEKIHETKALMEKLGLDLPIYVDGGVSEATAKKLLREGADVLICGSSVFYSNEATPEEIEQRVSYFKDLHY